MRTAIHSHIYVSVHVGLVTTIVGCILGVNLAIADESAWRKARSPPNIVYVSRTGFLTEPYLATVDVSHRLRVFYWEAYGKAKVFEGNVGQEGWSVIYTAALKAFEQRLKLFAVVKGMDEEVSYEPDGFEFMLLTETGRSSVESDLFFAGADLVEAVREIDDFVRLHANSHVGGTFLSAKPIEGVFIAPNGAKKSQYEVLKQGGATFARLANISDSSCRHALEKALKQAPAPVKIDAKTEVWLTGKQVLKRDGHNYVEYGDAGFDILLINAIYEKENEK